MSEAPRDDAWSPFARDAGKALLTPDWAAPANVRAFVTTRLMPGNSLPPFDACNLGARSGDDAGVVAANRAAVARALVLPSAPHWLRQVHGTNVVALDAASPRAVAFDDEPEADAAVTRVANVVLAVLTADCLPIFFSADDGSAVAIAHAGWRGLAAGVLEATVARLECRSERVVAWLGPAIAATSYEVGEEVRAAFVDRDADADVAFAPTRVGHWRCDLYALARRRLAGAGVARVSGGDFDTFTDPRFYSFRRDARTGRFASLIYIAP